MHKALIITRRELREIRRDWNVIGPTVFVPILLTGMLLFMIIGPAFDPHLERETEDLPGWFLSATAGLTPQQRVVAFMLKLIALPLFLMIPLVPTLAIAPDSFVGEKERKTIEPLLAAPISNLALFIGKVLTSVIPSLAATWLAFFIFATVMIPFTASVFSEIVFPDAAWLMSVFIIAPLLQLLGVGTSVLVSALVSTYRAATSLTGLVILPVIGLMFGQMLGLIVLTPVALIIVALVLVILDGIVFILAWGIFDREKLITGVG